MHKRRLSLLDKLISEADAVMKTITNRGHRAHRPSPSQGHTDSELSPSKRKHIAGLMRPGGDIEWSFGRKRGLGL